MLTDVGLQRLLKAGQPREIRFVTHVPPVLLVQISTVLPHFKALFLFPVCNLKTYRADYILLVESSWKEENSLAEPCHVETQGISFINC